MSRMDLTPAERAAAWVTLLLAAGVLLISLDMISGGRLFGRASSRNVDDLEAGEDDSGRGD